MTSHLDSARVIEVVRQPPLTAELKDRLLDIWVAVTNAGGAVSLLAPTSRALATPAAEKLWERVDSGHEALVTLLDDGEPIGWVTLARNDHPLMAHWRTVRRLQVLPSYQGKGYGGTLLRGAEDLARALGCEALHLTVRGGTGTEVFYERQGYTVVGRVPHALRVAPGDDREQLYLVKELTSRPGGPGPAPR